MPNAAIFSCTRTYRFLKSVSSSPSGAFFRGVCAFPVVTDNDLWDEPLPPAGSEVSEASVAVTSISFFRVSIMFIVICLDAGGRSFPRRWACPRPLIRPTRRYGLFRGYPAFPQDVPLSATWGRVRWHAQATEHPIPQATYSQANYRYHNILICLMKSIF